MKAQYIRLMDAIHSACLVIAGVCIVVITLIIPWGVFTRYVLNSASSWPEPLAILIMIVLSFFSAVVCYREYLHIGVGLLPAALERARQGHPRLDHRNLHDGHQLVPASGTASSSCTRPGTRASPSSRSSPSACPICRADRRRHHRALHHRAVPDAGILPRPHGRNHQQHLHRIVLRAARAHGRSHPSRRVHRPVPAWACRSPMRSASPRSWPRSTSICRSRRSRSRPRTAWTTSRSSRSRSSSSPAASWPKAAWRSGSSISPRCSSASSAAVSRS